MLIKHGANINTEDAERGTPLGWVIHAGTGDKIEEVRNYLISQGAKETLSFWGRLVFRVKGENLELNRIQFVY